MPTSWVPSARRSITGSRRICRDAISAAAVVTDSPGSTLTTSRVIHMLTIMVGPSRSGRDPQLLNLQLLAGGRGSEFVIRQ